MRSPRTGDEHEAGAFAPLPSRLSSEGGPDFQFIGTLMGNVGDVQRLVGEVPGLHERPTVLTVVEVDLRTTDVTEEFADNLVPHRPSEPEPTKVALTLGQVFQVGDLDEHVADTLGVLTVEVGKTVELLAGGAAAVEHERTFPSATKGR